MPVFINNVDDYLGPSQACVNPLFEAPPPPPPTKPPTPSTTNAQDDDIINDGGTKQTKIAFAPGQKECSSVAGTRILNG